jgi:GT2 family glycosyltransferase/glycosyltransferase involved in cell wall biosynthesis/predicted O-methyltransferase YrrM
LKSTDELLSFLAEKANTTSDINEHLFLLYRIVAETNAKKIIELGTRGGDSTCALTIGAVQTEGHVTSVDYGKGAEYSEDPSAWDALTKASAMITDELGLDEFWTLVIKNDIEFAKEYDEEVDVLFIDTVHSYDQTKMELDAWGNKVVDGGFIIIHDTVSFPEQNAAIWEFIDSFPSSQYVEHRNCNGLGIIIKQSGRLARDDENKDAVRKWYDRIGRMQEGILDMRARLREVKHANDQLALELDQVKETAEAERSSLIQQLNQVREELEQVREELEQVREELDGTSRGDFRRVVSRSVQLIIHEGLRSFAKKALKRMRRREFKIIDPLQGRIWKNPIAKERPPAELYGDELLLERLRQLIWARNARIEFPLHENPRISIIVVTYNKAHYALQCLRNILADKAPPFEVILIDNSSTDETRELLGTVRNARVILNSSNRFFAASNNQGAKVANGDYLLFLNQDAFIHPGCVSRLMKTLDLSSDIGAAGAKLIAPDGRLLEAGSIVWNDGSCLGYGRGDDPAKPEYCFLREVDYCSAACLMVRRDIFQTLGGFDEDFVPGYYEDTDLCVRLWEKGYRVIYQPLALATHMEFSSSSFDNATQLMARLRPVFLRKHEGSLKARYSQENVLPARNRRSSPSILMIDDCVPKPEEGSGFPRAFLMLKTIASLGYRLTFFPLMDGTPKQPETEILTQMGVEVLWGGGGLREVLQSRRNSFDLVIISRPHNALLAIGPVRATNPNTPVVYDAEALWHRREQIRQTYGLPPSDPRFCSEQAEMSLISSADYVMSVSTAEARIIEQALPGKRKVFVCGHPHQLRPTHAMFDERKGLLFLAGFKSSPGPNDDAIIHFTKRMFPEIQKQIPECKLIIGGSNPPDAIRKLSSDSIVVTGYLKNLADVYEKCRVFIAPMRFAAGTMWKITEAMSYGIPCVLSEVAAQGIEAHDGVEALVAKDDHEFVERTIRLYTDETKWNNIRQNGLEYIARNCDPSETKRKLGEFLKEALNKDEESLADGVGYFKKTVA